MLLPFADGLAAADEALSRRLTPQVVAGVVALIPDAWLQDDPLFATRSEQRDAYRDYLLRRLAAPRAFVEEAIRARAAQL